MYKLPKETVMTSSLLKKRFTGSSINRFGGHDHPVLCSQLKSFLTVVQLSDVSPAMELTLKVKVNFYIL
jgi:hypothetical protein